MRDAKGHYPRFRVVRGGCMDNIIGVSGYTVQKAEDFINGLPRKRFGCRMPRGRFEEQ